MADTSTVVSTREFRQGLAQYLARAAAGKPVTVTRHGRPDVVVVSAQDATTEGADEQ